MIAMHRYGINGRDLHYYASHIIDLENDECKPRGMKRGVHRNFPAHSVFHRKWLD